MKNIIRYSLNLLGACILFSQISCAQSGNMNVDMTTNNCMGKLTGSGNMQLAGNADDATLLVTGSGNIDAKKLSAKNWNVSKTGSGNAMH